MNRKEETDATRNLRQAVEAALTEDRAADDVTTAATIGDDLVGSAVIVAKAAGVIAGVAPGGETFLAVDRRLEVNWSVSDGDRVQPGDRIVHLRGPVASILRAERTALNYLMHLSGIATLTARFVKAVAGTGTEILDTRKTTPGLRHLEKSAVASGGGVNHRPDLAAMALLKENHITAAGGIDRAVARVRSHAPEIVIEVEVENENQLVEAIEAGADRIMLDDFSLGETGDAVRLVARLCERTEGGQGRPYIEASGGMSLDRVADVAACGVDGISIGALTHSAPALDLSLLVEEVVG